MHETDHSQNNIRIYLRLLDYTKYYLWALGLALLGNILFASVDASLTYMLKPILNKGFIARDSHFIHTLPWIVLGAFFARGLGNSVGSYCMAIVSRGVIMRLKQAMFKHLLYLPVSYYDHIASGKILSALTYNVEQVANAGADAITDFIQSGCLILGLLYVMFATSWQLSILYFVTLPVIAFAVHWSTQRLRRLSFNIQTQVGEVTNIAEESIEGYKVIRSFGGEEYEINKFNRATILNRWRELKLVLTKSLSVSGIQMIAGISLSITIYLAASHHSSAMLSAGAFASMIAAMLALLKPLKTFTKVNATIQKGLAGAQSIFALLDEEKERDTGTIKIARVKGKIEFQQVSFCYPKTQKPVLNEINLSIRPGEIVALVGHSGSGKTTLINLIRRFYDHDQGRIMIDNIDIRNFALADLRKQFANVSQNVVLFNDTIAHNIAYGRSDTPPLEEIKIAAGMAYALDFIEALPEQFNTPVGENGVLLSGGQRQRLAIARAILKEAPILILDEATSALDTEAERKIQSALETLMSQRTTIVIAHRLSTIEKAHKIVVLEEGRIKEIGTHQELLAQSQHYAKLYHLQFDSVK